MHEKRILAILKSRTTPFAIKKHDALKAQVPFVNK
jgi:hypothetical protein